VLSLIVTEHVDFQTKGNAERTDMTAKVAAAVERSGLDTGIAVIFVSGADFGTQRGPFISVDAYRDLFKPFHNRVNDWIHAHTTWKTFCHTCGGIVPLIPDLIDAGFDILNPVQCSAAGMDPHDLKKRFGSQLSFWGGGVDTQRTLPFESPDRVRDEVRARLRAFAPGGGFVFNAVHNIQARTPTENLLALFDTLKSCARYPVS